MCGMAMGGFGICGMAGQAGGAPGAAAGGGAPAAGEAAPAPPCRSRSAEPEITRVNSPGPLDAIGGGAAGCGNTGGENGAAGAAMGGADAKAGGAAAAGGTNAGGGATCGGCSVSARSICVNPPAAGGPAAAGGAAKIGAGGFASGSWFKAFRSCVKPPCAGGPDAAAGGAAGSLNRKLLSLDGCLAGSEEKGFNASRSGVDCGVGGGDMVENICVNEPGLELFGGSAKEGAGVKSGAAGGAAAPLAGSP